MKEAVSEMQHYDEFDYLVVNDDFENWILLIIPIYAKASLLLVLSNKGFK
jgi:guanylate kinase